VSLQKFPRPIKLHWGNGYMSLKFIFYARLQGNLTPAKIKERERRRKQLNGTAFLPLGQQNAVAQIF
jgi:hypothetical protein